MMDKIVSLPITKILFSDDSTGNVEDGFKKVSLMICKAGYVPSHNIYIEKDSIVNAQETVKNRPILCAYEIEDGEKVDFKGHEMDYKIIKEDGSYNLKVVYIEQPVGVIPESCNYRMENIDEEEWFTVDALLYADYCEDAVRILEESNGEKSVSMEITVTENSIDEDDINHINKFKFKGVTLLGAKHPPAIKGANAKIAFAQDDTFAQKYSQMLEHVNNINTSKGGNGMEDMIRQSIIEKYKYLSNNDKFQEIIDMEDIDEKALEDKLFSLSNADLQSRVRESLEEIKYTKKYYYSDEEYEYNKYWLCDLLMEENMAIVEDNENYGKYYGIPFCKNGDSIVLDTENIKRYIRGDWRVYAEGEVEPMVNPMFEDVEKINADKANQSKEEFEKISKELDEVKVSFTDLQSANSLIAEELKTLKEFEENIKKAEREAQVNEVMETFSELINVDGFEKINEQRFEISIDELVTKLKVLAFDSGIAINKKSKKQDSTTYVKTGLNFARETEELTEAEKRYGKDIKKYLEM